MHHDFLIPTLSHHLQYQKYSLIDTQAQFIKSLNFKSIKHLTFCTQIPSYFTLLGFYNALIIINILINARITPYFSNNLFHKKQTTPVQVLLLLLLHKSLSTNYLLVYAKPRNYESRNHLQISSSYSLPWHQLKHCVH